MLFDLVAKFSLLFHKSGQDSLEGLLLPPAIRVIEVKDIRYARVMENNSPECNAFCKNLKTSSSAEES